MSETNPLLEPQEYEYLWTDYDINYIFVSCYLFKEFKEADIVLIYDSKNMGLMFFISKKDIGKFADFGVKFLSEQFTEWEKEIKFNIENGRKLIEETPKDKLGNLANSKLKEKILERVKLFQSLGGNYFYTEFFFMSKVENLKDKAIKMKLKRMGELKFSARAILNDFYNYNKVFKPYIEETSKRTYRTDLQWLSFQEIAELLDGENVHLSKRNCFDWVLAKKTGWQILYNKAVITRFNNYFFNKKLSNVKGTVANPGTYQGSTKVIRTIFSDNINDELKKVVKGDILVANTTGPEVMAACQIAGAIITDEGGLTSHAAIVSRELRIPCIVGTKIATQVFKDGDLVEVDANKGIVKKIKG